MSKNNLKENIFNFRSHTIVLFSLLCVYFPAFSFAQVYISSDIQIYISKETTVTPNISSQRKTEAAQIYIAKGTTVIGLGNNLVTDINTVAPENFHLTKNTRKVKKKLADRASIKLPLPTTNRFIFKKHPTYNTTLVVSTYFKKSFFTPSNEALNLFIRFVKTKMESPFSKSKIKISTNYYSGKTVIFFASNSIRPPPYSNFLKIEENTFKNLKI